MLSRSIRVNAVDVLYAAFPMYLYFNPALGGYLLRPLLVAQDTPNYSQPYAAQGLGQYLYRRTSINQLTTCLVGSNFPNATAENVPHNFGIERTRGSFPSNSVALTLDCRIRKYDHNAFGASSSHWGWLFSRPTRKFKRWQMVDVAHSSQYDLIKGWAEYLVQNSMNPGLQYVLFRCLRIIRRKLSF